MRKTKIICTLGPSTDKGDNLKNMILSGMNVARMNFSHADHEEHFQRIKKIKKLRKELGLPIGLLLDTQGPEIRIKTFKEKSVNLIAGQKFTLTTRDVNGDNSIVSINYMGLPNDITNGTSILIDDGLIELKVLEIKNNCDIICEVQNTALLSDKKSVNIPGIKLSIPFISKKDENDIIFGIKNGINFIAASFTRNENDIKQLSDIIEKYDTSKTVEIIAKIENLEGVENAEKILKKCSGLMIARGDLGVEVPYYELPKIQKHLIKIAISLGKKVITATQMLESMSKNPRPTRAEVSDVANAIYDGTSAIMLSGETANGLYPVESVKTMSKIALQTEKNINYNKRRNTYKEFNLLKRTNYNNNKTVNILAESACNVTENLDCKATLIFINKDNLAQAISNFRPEKYVIAFTANIDIYIKLSLSWAIYPILLPILNEKNSLDNKFINEKLALFGFEKNDYIVTIGLPNFEDNSLYIKKI